MNGKNFQEETKMSGNNKMREEMVREFIKCLSEETIPWHMAWSTDRPVNAVTQDIME